MTMKFQNGKGYGKVLNLTTKSEAQAMLHPRNDLIFADPDLTVWKGKGGWYGVIVKDTEGRSVRVSVRKEVLDRMEAVKNEKLSKRLPYGTIKVDNKANFLTAFYEQGTRKSEWLRVTRKCEGLYKILTANNSNGDYDEELEELDKAIKSGNVVEMNEVFDRITALWTKKRWDEMLEYSNHSDEVDNAIEKSYGMGIA